jgi:cytolysin-activating lysine-acyltransferase
MRLTINSPLAPCELPETGQLSPYKAIGLVTDLAMNHCDYSDSSVKGLIDRLLPALNAGNANVFFDDARRPYAYASWSFLPGNLHQSMLDDSKKPHLNSTPFFNSARGENLWFFDLLCPFSNPLNLFKTLRNSFSDYGSAYLYPKTPSYAVRRIW